MLHEQMDCGGEEDGLGRRTGSIIHWRKHLGVIGTSFADKLLVAIERLVLRRAILLIALDF
jgi:hypothetical protein